MRFFVIILFAFLAAPVYGDVFMLREGGKIEGELLNPDDLPPKPYTIRTADGIEIRLERKLIERARKGEKETVAEYNAFAPFKEDTVENHLETADWCRERRLIDHWKRHLRRVLELDPENKTARQLLGYIRGADGNWTSREEMLGDQGLLNVNNSWKSQQQIDIEQYLEKSKKIDLQWTRTVDSLRARAQSRDQQAKGELQSIREPAAGPALVKSLQAESDPNLRMIYIKALGNIGTLATLSEVARWVLDPRERNHEVRLTCFDVLKKHPEAMPAIIGSYARLLKAENGPEAINKAAFAIGQLGGSSAIPQLIDVLETTHSWTETVKSQGNANNSGEFAWGQSTVKRSKTVTNPEVHKALFLLTGVDFQFNKDAWKAWLIQTRKTPTFDPRRG